MKKLMNFFLESKLWFMIKLFALIGFIIMLLSSWTLIFVNANHLGIFFIPAMCLYCGAMSGARKLLVWHDFKLSLHAALGDEEYFARYPRERKHWKRKIARRKQKCACAKEKRKAAERMRERYAPAAEWLLAACRKKCGQIYESFRFSILGTLIETYAFYCVRMILAFSTVFILLHAPTLGVLFAPVILVYVTLILLPFYMIESAKDKRMMKRMMGAEQYSAMEKDKGKRAFLKRVAREYGKDGPDLPDTGFACWCETSPEKT